MKKSYYLFNPGRLSRKDNTLCFVPVDEQGNEGQPRYIPIEGVDNLYCFGSLDANSAMYNFLGKNHIAVHFFDYYEHYTGRLCPKSTYWQVKCRWNKPNIIFLIKRMVVAKTFVEGAAFNMTKNLKYYQGRGKDIAKPLAQIENYTTLIEGAMQVDQLMGIEGNIRQAYYEAFGKLSMILRWNRSKQPPQNEVNALISFGNMMCYSVCLDQIYHTQLNPTISFLHEPGARRYSLALDLSEIFKPILVDRTIFSVLNKKQIQASDFRQDLNRCVLKVYGT